MGRWETKIFSVAGLLILLALPFLAFWPVTVGSQVWAIGDFAAYHWPLFVVAAEQWRKGHFPLWNPYMFGGTPLAAAQQVGAFYPLNIVLWLIFPAWRAMGISVLLHLALTGLSVFLFLRSLHLHPAAAYLGALVFAWGGFSMSHLGHLGILRALPWIGFSLHGFNMWIEGRRTFYLLEIAFSVAMLCLSGYVQIILYALLLVLSYFWMALPAGWGEKAPALSALGLGIGISAVQVIPGVSLWISREYLRPGEGIYSAMMGYSFHPAYWFTLLFPRGRSGTFAEMVAYVGIVPLILIGIEFLLRKEEHIARISRFFSIWLLISALLSMGRYLPLLAMLVFSIPVFGNLGVPSKHLLEFSFSAAVLTALGLDHLLRKMPWIRPSKLHMFVGMIVLISYIVLAVITPYAHDTPPLRLSFSSWKILWQPLVLLALGVILIIAILRIQIQWKLVGILLLLSAVATWDLLDFGLPIYQPGLTAPDFYENPPATVRWLQAQHKSLNPYRVLSFEATGHMLERERGKSLLAANYPAAFGIESLIGHDGLMLRRVHSAFQGRIPPWGYVEPEAIDDPGFRTLLDWMGVRWLLIDSSHSTFLASYFRIVNSINGVDIYINEHAHPRLFVATNDDHGREIFEDDLGVKWTKLAENKYNISVLSYKLDFIEAEIFVKSDSLIIHGVPFVPGWRVFVDGVQRSLHRVNGLLQGVTLAPGVHRVVFRYDPVDFRIGLGISGLSMVVLLVWCGWVEWKHVHPQIIIQQEGKHR
jgi:hypothetical protein